jgi:hypothetical protein
VAERAVLVGTNKDVNGIVSLQHGHALHWHLDTNNWHFIQCATPQQRMRSSASLFIDS